MMIGMKVSMISGSIIAHNGRRLVQLLTLKNKNVELLNTYKNELTIEYHGNGN